MDVEIDDGDARQAAPFQRMQRADGDVAEEAETHGAGLLGVVAGRAGGDEGVPGSTVEHGIDGSDHPAHAL
jgi:hypothetical protein